MVADNDIHYMVTVRARHAGGYYGWSGLSVIWAYTPPAAQSTPTALRNTLLPAVPVTKSTSNLRQGPGTTYEVVGQLDAGTSLTPVARNGDGTWLQLDVGVWIWASLVNNIPVGLPLATKIPPIPNSISTPEPTATPLPAFTPTPVPTAISGVNPQPTATPLKIPLFDTPPQPMPAPITPDNHGRGMVATVPVNA